MIRFKTIGAALLIAALATGSAVAQGPRGGGAGRGGGGGGPLAGIPLESLNLTAAQQDQIRNIRERQRQEMQALQERMRAEILSVLTAEQQAQVKQRQAEQGGSAPAGRERRRGQQQ
jgi:Spy/CpxP family protein refolding chaperone